MARIETNETILAQAVPGSISLRTTAPANIVKKLDLARGGRLVWDIDKKHNCWIAIIQKK